MSKVILSGAAGFVGSHVYDLLIKEGHEVCCIDDLSSGKRENLPKKVDIAIISVCDFYSVMAEFVDMEPDAVIHLAAQPSICSSIDCPTKDANVNIMGTLAMITAAKKLNVKKFIFSSSAAVYSDTFYHLKPIDETDPILPSSPYGISKFTAESYIRHLMPREGIVLRFANVFGPKQVPLGENQVIPRMIRHFEKGDPFFIHGDGEQKRDMVFVEDVAEACVMALNGKAGTYNIASGESVSVNQITRYMEQIYDLDGYAWEHDEKTDPRRDTCMQVNRAKLGLGWRAVTPFYEGLKQTVDWWKKK